MKTAKMVTPSIKIRAGLFTTISLMRSVIQKMYPMFSADIFI